MSSKYYGILSSEYLEFRSKKEKGMVGLARNDPVSILLFF